MGATIVIEGGGTRTRAAFYTASGDLVRVVEGGPSNPVAYGAATATRRIAALARQALAGEDSSGLRVYAALAGVSDEALGAAMSAGIGRLLLPAEVWVTSDLHAMLHANAGSRPGILVIAGTGAAILAQDGLDMRLRAGGRGTLFGDTGSAYALAVAGLRACACARDGVGMQTCLTEMLPRHAGLTTFEAFVAWSSKATKQEVAGLAPIVTQAAEQGDTVARSCVKEEARQLSFLVTAVQEKLGLAPDVTLFEYGGLLSGCPLFREFFHQALRHCDSLKTVPCSITGHEALYCLSQLRTPPPWVYTWKRDEAPGLPLQPDTEMPYGGLPLDALSTDALVARMQAADQEAVAAVGEAAEAIATAVEQAARCIQEGGRIIYAGAGTSGRLGVLDASECPPTFGVSPERVRALIAGGDHALRFSVEGAEDSAEQGARDLQLLEARSCDFVVGIAASGNTPYVSGVFRAARAAGAVTALITSNPDGALEADIRIVMNTGPEVLTGSTRLKAGTAAKLALNRISTGAFTRAGFVYQGHMVGMLPKNAKLRGRAVRIVAELGGVAEGQALDALERSDYHIASALLMLRRPLTREEALDILARYGGNLRNALADTADKPR